jgi:hypothetical protein
MGEYINIYGLLFAKTADGKLAFTGQIWDETLQKFQSDINAKTPQLGEDGKLPIDLLPESLQNATSSEVVASLPETGEANKIYLVKREGSDPVVYDPSMWIDGAWASFGGSDGGSVTWDDILNKPTIANTYQLPDDFQFGTPVSDEVHAAIMAAKLIIVPQMYTGTPAYAGMILTFTTATNGILYFNAPYIADSFVRITYTEATKILSAPASSHYIDYSAVHTTQQTLSTAQKTQARTNIGAADEEALKTLSDNFVMPMMEALVPMNAGTGGDDLSQYDIAANSDMYNFLMKLIKFQNTIGSELTNQVFWFYTQNSDPDDSGRVFSAVISWASTDNGKKFTVIRANGDVAEYEITIDESGSEVVPTALTRLNHSNLFAAGTGAVLYDKAQTLQDAEKLQARENIGAASQADVDEINQILFTQYTALTMSRTPASFEKGVETAVTLNWSTKFNNQEVTPDSIEVKKGSTVLTTDKTLKTIGDNVSDTQAYSMTAVIKGITKTASVTVNAYYPMYFGASAKDALVSADVLALTKQPIKSSPAGNVTVEVGANEYLWLCVPSTMTINSVKSGGFDVPMAAPVTVAVDGKGDYKCYRSAGPFAEGTFNGVIA